MESSSPILMVKGLRIFAVHPKRFCTPPLSEILLSIRRNSSYAFHLTLHVVHLSSCALAVKVAYVYYVKIIVEIENKR